MAFPDSFVEEVRDVYPDATLLCTNGPLLSDGYPVGAMTLTRARAAIAAVKPLANRPAAQTAADRQAPAVADPVFDGEAGQYPYHFLPYASQGLYDGSLAHLPWLQEMPDPMSSAMWCSWVEINEQKAHELGTYTGKIEFVSESLMSNFPYDEARPVSPT